MTDRELLEKAAAAAGIEYEQPKAQMWPGGLWIVRDAVWWNPLASDSDALRLAVKLRMMLDDVRIGYMAGHIVAVSGAEAAYEPRDPDPHAATRRCIVRAAASIGPTP